MNNMCPVCQKEVEPNAIFCSHCGANLSEKTTPLSVGKKIRIYLLSFFLAPFGLYWFFKFLKSENPSKKTVGRNALIITILAVALMLLTGLYAINMYSKLLGSYMYM